MVMLSLSALSLSCVSMWWPCCACPTFSHSTCLSPPPYPTGLTLSLVLLLWVSPSIARISVDSHGDRELKNYDYEDWEDKEKKDSKDDNDNGLDENGDPYADGLGICGIEDKCGEYGFNLYKVRAVSGT